MSDVIHFLFGFKNIFVVFSNIYKNRFTYFGKNIFSNNTNLFHLLKTIFFSEQRIIEKTLFGISFIKTLVVFNNLKIFFQYRRKNPIIMRKKKF